MAHIHEPVTPPRELDPTVDPHVETVLLLALSKAPEERPNTATEFMEALSLVAGSQRDVDVESQPTLETPPLGAIDEMAAVPKDRKTSTAATADEVRISLDQARVLAIRHVREHTYFYGPRYAKRELAWEVTGSEAGEDYFQVRLSYRPARRFWGQPGVELFTIDKAGSVELRQIMDEPTEGLRQLINEPVRAMGLRFPLVGLALLVVVAVAAYGLLSSAGSETGALSAPPNTVSLRVTPGEPGQLVSSGGDLTVNIAVGSVEASVRLWLQPISPEQVPQPPQGFASSEKAFDLSVAGDQTASEGEFAFSKPITVTVRLSAQDAWDADGAESNVAIYHFADKNVGWVALPTMVDFRASTAKAQLSSLSIFALFIREMNPTPTLAATPEPTAAPLPSPVATAQVSAPWAPLDYSTRTDETYRFSFDYPTEWTVDIKLGGFYANPAGEVGLMLATGQDAPGLKLDKYVNLNIDTLQEVLAGFEVVALGKTEFTWTDAAGAGIGNGSVLEFTFRDERAQRFRGKVLMALNRAGSGETSFVIRIIGPQDDFEKYDNVFQRAVESVKLYAPTPSGP